MGGVDDFRVFVLFILVRLPEAGPVYRRTPRVRGTCTGKRGADRGVTSRSSFWAWTVAPASRRTL